MRVVTQNCFNIFLPGGLARLQRIVSKIIDLQPDVVFLQEILFTNALKILKIPNYQTIYVKNRPFIKGGLVTLIKNNLHIQESSLVVYKSKGALLSKQLADRILQKGFLDIKLGNNLHVINTHILATYSKAFVVDENQLHQLHELIDYVSKCRNAILGGDFNFDENCSYYKELITEVDDKTFGLGNSSLNNPRKLDFIFTKLPGSTVTKVNYIDYNTLQYPSDHRGIFLDLAIDTL